MSIDYSTVALLDDLKRRGSLPTSQELFTDADLCRFMTDGQKMRVVPQILKTREEHFVSTYDVPVVAQQVKYKIPARAIGNKIRNIFILSGGNEDDIRELPQFSATEGAKLGQRSQELFCGYYFEGNNIVLMGTPKVAGDVIRIKYYRKPNRIVDSSQAAKITAIDTGTNQVTVSSMPSSWEIGDDLICDLIPNNGIFDSVADDSPVQVIDNTTSLILELDPSVINEVAIGDWVCIAGETTIPQLPEDLHQILIQFALVKVFESLGDTNGVSLASKDLDELEQSLYTMLEHRDESHPLPIATDGSLWRARYRRNSFFRKN